MGYAAHPCRVPWATRSAWEVTSERTWHRLLSPKQSATPVIPLGCNPTHVTLYTPQQPLLTDFLYKTVQYVILCKYTVRKNLFQFDALVSVLWTITIRSMGRAWVPLCGKVRYDNHGRAAWRAVFEQQRSRGVYSVPSVGYLIFLTRFRKTLMQVSR